MKKIFLALFVGLLFLGSCSKDDVKDNKEGNNTNNEIPLSVETKELRILVNESANIKATSSNKITFSTENAEIATVDNSGKVSAVSVGETLVNVTDGKTSEKVKITVYTNEIPLSVKKTELEILVGETTNIEATSSNDITYTSEETIIAKVGDTGNVQARYVGETIIKVTDGKNSIDVKVVVLPKSKIFVEPDFTSTRSQYEQKYNEDITRTQQSGDLVAYFFKSGVKKYEYYYTFNDTYRDIVVLGIPSSSTSYSADSIADWIKERYILVEKKNNKYSYISPNKKIIVTVEGVTNGLKITFVKE